MLKESILPDRTEPVDPHDPEEFDNSLLPPAVAASFLATAQAKSKHVLRIVGAFLLGQGAAQAVNVIGGFLLVRTLSVEAYAQFGIVTGFQTVFTVLMDLGFAGTIIPLVGSRNRDPLVIGRYVRAARHLRNRTFLILAPVASIAFFATVHKHHWAWYLQVLLLASVLISLYSGGVFSFFSAPLFLFGRLREYYLPQVISGTARLAAYIGLALVGGLNSWVAAGLAALNITINGIFVRRSALKFIDWPAHDDREAERELIQYVIPATPAIVFSAFQSQISLFLISFFGSTLNIAEVSALGRIGQLFAVLMTFNSIVIEPHIARIARDELLRRFLGFVALTTLGCTPVLVIAFVWPGIFLFVLGSKFEGVRAPIGWYVLAACMNSVSGLIWVMNRARKWVFWSGSILEVVLLLVVQVAFLMIFGVHNTQQAVLFNVASSCCYMVAHVYVAIRGFLSAEPERSRAV